MRLAALVSFACPRAPSESATMRRSISTYSPDSGSVDQPGLALTWNSTIQPRPRGAPVTRGVPGGNPRPAVRGKLDRRFGQDLPRNGDVARHGKTAERRIRFEGCELLRLRPGERAAHVSPAASGVHT